MDTFPAPGLLGFRPEGVLLNNLYSTNFNLPRCQIMFHACPHYVIVVGRCCCVCKTQICLNFCYSIKQALRKVACEVSLVTILILSGEVRHYFIGTISAPIFSYTVKRVLIMSKKIGIQFWATGWIGAPWVVQPWFNLVWGCKKGGTSLLSSSSCHVIADTIILSIFRISFQLLLPLSTPYSRIGFHHCHQMSELGYSSNLIATITYDLLHHHHQKVRQLARLTVALNKFGRVNMFGPGTTCRWESH